MDAAVDAAPIATPSDAALVADAAAAPVAVALDSLPTWDVPAVPARGKPTEIYAVEMDGDFLLANLATDPLLVAPSGRKLTGRVSAPSQSAAYAAVAKQLGADIKPRVFKGRGPTIDLTFAKAPVADLLRLLGDLGKVNIVTHAQLPADVTIVTRRASWEGVLAAIVEHGGTKIVAHGNTRYILAKDATLPPLPKGASKVIVDLDISDGTIAHALAALRAVTPLPLTACGGKRFTIRLRKLPLAEALRALGMLGGVAVEEGGPCKVGPLDAAPIDELKLVAVAGAGIKRAAAFDRKGEMLVATRDGTLVRDIGDGFVEIEGGTLQLYSRRLPAVDETLPPRTAALIKIGDDWSGYIERAGTYQHVDNDAPFNGPSGERVSREGIRGADGAVSPLAKP